MKCCHLLAALALVGCGLDTGALPSTRRGPDAGVNASEDRGAVAGSLANWPTRRSPGTIQRDGGSDDTSKPTSKPPAGGSAAKPTNADDEPTQGSNAADGGSSNGGPSQPSGQSPSKGIPSAQADGDQSTPNEANGGNAGAAGDAAATVDAGSASGDASSSDPDDQDPSSGPDDSSNGSQDPAPNNGTTGDYDAIDAIVDLVFAILDLSLGPVRPAEIEGLVSAILVLSLAPAELVADSLIAVFDALDDTRICSDHPERCNPLCENLESDCRVCGQDNACIERIESMCEVRLPRSCH